MYYPIMLNLEDKKALVVGGGKTGLRKAKGLLEAGAYVKIIEKEGFDIGKLNIQNEKLEIIIANLEECDLKEIDIMFSCTSDESENDRMQKLAKKYNILFSRVDKPDTSDFITPSIFRDGNLTIAISTGGANPTLAKEIRDDIKRDYSGMYREKIDLLKELREYILENYEKNQREEMLKSLGSMTLEELRGRRSQIEDKGWKPRK